MQFNQNEQFMASGYPIDLPVKNHYPLPTIQIIQIV